MPEDFYAALMMRRALPTTTNIKTITAPGIYPVDAGNANAPVTTAGLLIVLLPTTRPTVKFISSDWNVYTLISGNWQGFGNAAILNVTTSQTDTTAGRVLNVGYGGLGGNAPRTAVVASDSYDNIPMGLPSGFYTHCVGGGPYAVTFSLREDGGGTLNNRHLIIPLGPNNKIAVRFDGASGVGTKEYQYFYTDKNKPTAVDVGALPLTGGALTNDSAVLTLKNKTLDKSIYLLAKNQDNTNRWYVGNGSDSNDDVLLSNYIGGNRLQLTADGSIALTVSGGKSCTVNGQIVPSSYANFDARYLTDSRLGARNYRAMTKGVMFEVAGNVVTGLQIEGQVDNDGDFIVMRPLQKLLNGTWYTVAQV